MGAERLVGLIPDSQPLGKAQLGSRGLLRRQANGVSGGSEMNLIARFDPILGGQGFGQGDLQFAGDFSHALTLARINSLFKGLGRKITQPWGQLVSIGRC
jgi:hypothetical protein